MNTKQYRVYGLVIRSEIEFEELIETDQAYDVDISLQPVPEKIKRKLMNRVIAIIENSLIFRINDVFFYTSNGNQIIIEMNQQMDINTIKLYVLGTCLGAILMQRGTIPLHGSAIQFKSKGVLVLGDSGAGKSTLVNCLLAKDCLILTDDVIATCKDNNKYFALSSYPEQKLHEEALAKNTIKLYRNKKVPYIDNNKKKYYISRSSQFFDGKTSIDIIIVLVISDDVKLEITKVKGVKKVEMLMNNIYRYEFITGLNILEKCFEVCSEIASQADIYLIRRPQNLQTVDEITKMIDYII